MSGTSSEPHGRYNGWSMHRKEIFDAKDQLPGETSSERYKRKIAEATDSWATMTRDQKRQKSEQATTTNRQIKDSQKTKSAEKDKLETEQIEKEGKEREAHLHVLGLLKSLQQHSAQMTLPSRRNISSTNLAPARAADERFHDIAAQQQDQDQVLAQDALCQPSAPETATLLH